VPRPSIGSGIRGTSFNRGRNARDLEAPPGALTSVWTSPERTEILRRNADRVAAETRAASALLLDAAELVPRQVVLDLACGPGDPTVEIAARVGPAGRVVGVDLSEGALEVAKERAQRFGARNVAFRTSTADGLPFPDASFDRGICRFGIMFFDPLPAAAKEARRVLHAGGRLALKVWGPRRQPFFDATMGVILRHLGLADPPPELLIPFRFDHAGPLEHALIDAGFAQVTERTQTAEWVATGSPEQVAETWRAGALVYRPLLDRLSAADAAAVASEIADRFRSFYDGASIRVPEIVRIVTALK
jgi:ubiquinone/menaquinone biosynthesis C-methylase UbiE